MSLDFPNNRCTNKMTQYIYNKIENGNGECVKENGQRDNNPTNMLECLIVYEIVETEIKLCFFC